MSVNVTISANHHLLISLHLQCMSQKNTKITFLILPHIHMLDLSGPEQVFLEARDMGLAIDIIHCSAVAEVTSSSGLSICQLQSIDQVQIAEGDYIIIPGTDLTYTLNQPIPGKQQIFQWLRNANQQGAIICSICTGAFFLAESGLLDGLRCTTHWKRTKQLASMYPALKVQEDVLYSEEIGFLTSAGVTAGIDLSLDIVSKLKDEQLAFNVARELVVYSRRKLDDPQISAYIDYRNHIHSGIHKIQDHIQHSIGSDLSLGALSKLANMSERNLTRVFKKVTGITINEYVSIIRKEYLQKIKDDPELTRKQMASLCGLKSERHLIRLLKSPITGQ